MDEALLGMADLSCCITSPVRLYVGGEFGGRELRGMARVERISSESPGFSGSLTPMHLDLHDISRRIDGRRSLKLRCRPGKANFVLYK